MSFSPDVVTSTSNRRIVEARKLDQRKHRQRQDRFLVEGLQILHMALDADSRPFEVFYCGGLFAGDAHSKQNRLPCLFVFFIILV